jgi:hypothetical protein
MMQVTRCIKCFQDFAVEALDREPAGVSSACGGANMIAVFSISPGGLDYFCC